ncbi:MAG: hypothetical protein KAJ19_12215, partial [Gammaproteobacteria bacterium]|nr:hypothetical protein [Gammaproteobacteria bacterium]
MAVLQGKDGAILIGATSNTTFAYIISWALTYSVDEYTQKPLSQAFTSRITGHTDWTCTIEVDYDAADTELDRIKVPGTAVVLFLHVDETTPAGWTCTGVVLTATFTVSGTAINKLSVSIGGNST